MSKYTTQQLKEMSEKLLVAKEQQPDAYQFFLMMVHMYTGCNEEYILNQAKVWIEDGSN